MSDVDTEALPYLEEACYYLRKKGLSFQEVSKALEIPEPQANRLFEVYQSKIAKGLAEESEVDRNLWEDVYNDSFGNEKITFARENGFYHCRRLDLETMDSDALMNIFETRAPRHLVDTRVCRIYEGTDEIMVQKIAVSLLGTEYEAYR